MRRRQPTPTLWLMTDERADAMLEAALARLPRGGGVVFRHHATPRAERRQRFETVLRIARRRGLVLVLAGSPEDAVAWRADGWHGRSARRLPPRLTVRTMPAHDRIALVAAARWRVDLAFLSPVFPTRSHPGAAAIGPLRFAASIRGISVPVAALGGMDARRGRRLRRCGAAGWAAIDGWNA